MYGLIAALVLNAAATRVTVSRESTPFSDAWLRSRAQRLAQGSYIKTPQKIPDELANLSYDQYREIRFRQEASIWRDQKLPFELQLFHVGHFYQEPVSLSIVEGGRARAVGYTSALFDYGKNKFAEPLPESLGYAGFRVHYPLNSKTYLDELLVFLGASYFRALGKDNSYGLSARGLAIDTALPSGEIFPVFREFYVEKPSADARQLVVHALLDSPNVTGAFRFDIAPGDPTEVRVAATLYPRGKVERLGIAPLTSMYLYGENDRGNFDDYRPEVHDSDGLLMWLGNGERLWRPLQNPDHLEVSVLRADTLKGFGLFQRDRHQTHYEDLDARYEKRPSVWIEPNEGFGAGAVFLVEIPSREDIHDNVVAFFTPDKPAEPGKPIRLSYRMFWGMSPGPKLGVSSTMATHTGNAWLAGVPADKQPLEATARKIIIDFASPHPVSDDVEAVVSLGSGAVRNTRVQPHPGISGYRAVFDFIPSSTDPVEMRCFLRKKDTALSETWSYRFMPQKVETK